MVFWRKMFYLLRNLLAVFGLLCLVAGGIGAFVVAKSYNLPPRVFAEKVLAKTGLDRSSFLVGLVQAEPLKPEDVRLPALDDPGWKGQGARKTRTLAPFYYSRDGLPVPQVWLNEAQRSAYVRPQALRQVAVENPKDILEAIRSAEPGDVITLAPGTYRFNTRSIGVSRPGTAEHPIQVRAAELGQVRIELNGLEGFLVNAPFWVFENLDIKGVCSNHGSCEHAFHVVGRGSGFVLRNSRLHEFNAMIKANGLDSRDGGRNFPDGALIEGNSFFNSEIRQTRSPVVPIDVVGADDWIIRENFIADYSKGLGDQISTAAFIKGNASGGVFENNLVVGEYNHSGGVRLGLSFGGGGTSKGASRHKDNSIESTGGIMRNNIVMYTRDVGVYLNKARDTQVLNNLLFQTMGIDVRFPVSTAVIKNNVLNGKIRERDGGTAIMENNLILSGGFLKKDFGDIFQNPHEGDFTLVDRVPLQDKGVPNQLVRFDFCDQPRESVPNLGPFESDCRPFFMGDSVRR
jgi:hypothetical protein